ncbi:hypothetical protein HMPREF1402_01444 [Helicobacter pylori GAM121Aii]|nr:hypothetical protein HMPREF1402_01444 [Helicobacter pylori GAM121Aii]
MIKRAKLKTKLKNVKQKSGLNRLTYYQIISFLDCKQQHNSDKQ